MNGKILTTNEVYIQMAIIANLAYKHGLRKGYSAGTKGEGV